MTGTVALVAALALAASGPASARGTAASASEGHATVKIKSFAFAPFKLTVARGSEVTFVNRDSVAHRPKKNGAFDAGRIRGGGSESVRFGKRGTYRYICSIHPFMHGKIVVH